MSTIPVSSVEQITAPVELTDDILRSEVADILPLNQLQTLEAETFSSTVNTWLTQLKIEYTTENNQTKDIAIVIDDTRYTIASPEDFESRVETIVRDYIRNLEGLVQDKQEALLSYITAIEVDVVLPTVAAVEEQEISTTQEIFDEALSNRQNHPRLFDLLPGTQLYDVMQDYAEQHNISVEALAEKIAGTQQEIIQRFFVGIPLTEQNKQVISTATSLYLFQLYSSDTQMREEMFAGEEALQIKGDNIFGELFAWTKEIGTKNLFQMSGIMQFFMIFKDEEIQVALTEARQYKTFGGAQIDGMRNPYLENPHKFYQLMQGYLTQPAAERTDRVKQQLLAVNNKVNGETLPEYIVDDTEKKQMQAIVTNYGGNVTEFEQFMGYVDQGDTFLEHADEIKTSLIESDTLGGLAYILTQAREVFGSLGNAFGTKWEESSLFKWIDGVLGWLGFDGLDGYVDERAIHRIIGPLVDAYVQEDITRTRTTPAFWDTLTKVTDGEEHQQTILDAAGSIDIQKVYAMMSGDNTQKKDFLGDKGEQLNTLLPETLHSASLEDRFMYASAFIIERMANSRLAKHMNDTDAFIKYVMLFLAVPNKGKKYFTIVESHSKYRGEEVVSTNTHPDLPETPDLMPTRAAVAQAMDEIIAHDQNQPIGYDFGDGALGPDNDMDCSGMVCEIFSRAGVDTSPRTSRGYFKAYSEYVSPIETKNMAAGLDGLQKGDLLFWNNKGDYQWKSSLIPTFEQGGATFKIHHIAMVLSSNPSAGTITILETAGSTGTIVRTIPVTEEMNKRDDELWVARMPYDAGQQPIA